MSNSLYADWCHIVKSACFIQSFTILHNKKQFPSITKGGLNLNVSIKDLVLRIMLEINT